MIFSVIFLSTLLVIGYFWHSDHKNLKNKCADLELDIFFKNLNLNTLKSEESQNCKTIERLVSINQNLQRQSDERVVAKVEQFYRDLDEHDRTHCCLPTLEAIRNKS